MDLISVIYTANENNDIKSSTNSMYWTVNYMEVFLETLTDLTITKCSLKYQDENKKKS